jgi:hypothetical protein
MTVFAPLVAARNLAVVSAYALAELSGVNAAARVWMRRHGVLLGIGGEGV